MQGCHFSANQVIVKEFLLLLAEGRNKVELAFFFKFLSQLISKDFFFIFHKEAYYKHVTWNHIMVERIVIYFMPCYLVHSKPFVERFWL